MSLHFPCAGKPHLTDGSCDRDGKSLGLFLRTTEMSLICIQLKSKQLTLKKVQFPREFGVSMQIEPHTHITSKNSAVSPNMGQRVRDFGRTKRGSELRVLGFLEFTNWVCAKATGAEKEELE